MTIREYYANYKVSCKYGVALTKGSDATMNDFYENCICKNKLEPENVLAWHKMLVEYAERPDAIYWVRYYEGGSKASGRWNNRRASKTMFADGFSYVFVSNYDVHEIFNMIRLGVTPNACEFAEMMKNHIFPLHYDSGSSCEESDIASYPKIGSTQSGILTAKHWYLAHIYDVKGQYLRSDGTCIVVDVNSAEGQKIYPRGNLKDWRPNGDGRKVRKLDYSLSYEEKALVKAHFLRFADPLNYYVVPGQDWETNDVCSRIGEYPLLNQFMAQKHETLYGSTVMDEFRNKALIDNSAATVSGDSIINVKYGMYHGKAASSKKTYGLSKEKIDEMVKEFLSDPNTSYRKLDVKYGLGDGAARGGGFKSREILLSRGITADMKGHFMFVVFGNVESQQQSEDGKNDNSGDQNTEN